MATAPIESTEPAAAPAAGGIKKLLPLIVAVVAGLAVGGASGAFFVGPAMAKGIGSGGAPVAAVADSADAAGTDEEGEDGEPAEAGAEGGKEGEGAAAAKSVHVLDNIVLNPAGSGGTRFLLLSVAFELKDAAAADEMKARDAELRDVVLVTLGAKTVEELSDMAVREPLKVELRAAAEKTFKKGGIKRIYFPQFVIQ
jgi:flagellar FliL protein